METAFLADSSPWNQTYTRDKERNPERDMKHVDQNMNPEMLSLSLHHSVFTWARRQTMRKFSCNPKKLEVSSDMKHVNQETSNEPSLGREGKGREEKEVACAGNPSMECFLPKWAFHLQPHMPSWHTRLWMEYSLEQKAFLWEVLLGLPPPSFCWWRMLLPFAVLLIEPELGLHLPLRGLLLGVPYFDEIPRDGMRVFFCFDGLLEPLMAVGWHVTMALSTILSLISLNLYSSIHPLAQHVKVQRHHLETCSWHLNRASESAHQRREMIWNHVESPTGSSHRDISTGTVASWIEPGKPWSTRRHAIGSVAFHLPGPTDTYLLYFDLCIFLIIFI